MSKLVTLVKEPIFHPSEPRHFMVLNALSHSVRAEFQGEIVAISDQVIRLQEVGCQVYAPVVYFPQDAFIHGELISQNKLISCTLKGTGEYFDLVVNGNVIKNAAWSYTRTHVFDHRIHQIEGYVAFDTSLIQITELTVKK